MKNFGFVCLLLSFVNSVSAQHYPDKPATHGMLIMGTRYIYASHLPMFHSPHDYQIILAIKFGEEGNTEYLADRNAHPGELVYTIEPEVFTLPQMVKHTKKFRASIYRGHFERGGILIAKDVPVTIENVIYYSRLKRDAIRPEFLKYILFGNPEEQFIAHQISAGPDFDEITAVKVSDKEITKSMQSSSYKRVEFKEKDLRQKFSWKTNTGYLSKSRKVEFTLHQNLYFELGDLD